MPPRGSQRNALSTMVEISVEAGVLTGLRNPWQKAARPSAMLLQMVTPPGLGNGPKEPAHRGPGVIIHHSKDQRDPAQPNDLRVHNQLGWISVMLLQMDTPPGSESMMESSHGQRQQHRPHRHEPPQPWRDLTEPKAGSGSECTSATCVECVCACKWSAFDAHPSRAVFVCRLKSGQ